jgi:hypothetical protein
MNYKDYMSKEKTLIKKCLFWKLFDNQPTWKDIKHLDLQDDDEIICSYEEHSENDEDSYWFISVVRWNEETDEEFKKRLEELEDNKKRLKKMRYQSYLKLKEEFENNENI